MKRMSLGRAVRLIERDHGGCDSQTCTISVALREGFHVVAVESWIGSGAASKEFDGVELPFSFEDARRESAEMCESVPHVECPHCNAVIWNPKDCNYWCDSCGKQVDRGAA